MPIIKTKRIYEPKESTDGYRILVDRIWPRGIKKEDGLFDIWIKEIAPSTQLRKWFDHDAAKWKIFTEKYTAELTASPLTKELINIIKQHKVISLLYSAKNEQHNQAVVLQSFLAERI